jgi:hypothetical protein
MPTPFPDPARREGLADKVRLHLKTLRPAVLVLYHARGVAQLPMRKAIEDHILAWGRHSRYPVVYHNFAFGFDWNAFKDLPIAAVLLDTLALNIRWSPDYFAERTAPLLALRGFHGPKIAMPQDEFIHTDSLGQFLAAIGCTHLLSAASEPQARRIYGRHLPKVQYGTKLTGYLEPSTLRRIDELSRREPRRDLDVGYRAWRAEPWLGEHGMLKLRVAEAAQSLAGQFPDLTLDISTDDADVFTGDDWYRFLLRCRSTLGVEGGASVLDRDGSLCLRTRGYVMANPQASFEEVRTACFADHEGSLELFALGPRHLEACATRTCQLLVEGQYQGVLRAGIDYIAIARDFSNLPDVLAQARDHERLQAVAESAYRRVVGSGQYTYGGFVRSVEESIIDRAATALGVPGRSGRAGVHAAMRRHAQVWDFALYEAESLLPHRQAFEQSAELRWTAERERVQEFAVTVGLDLTLH